VDCEQALHLLSARLDGEAASADEAALDEHLAHCPACGSAAEAFRAQDESLRQAFAPRRRAAALLAERVVGRLQAAPPPRRGLPSWLPLLLAAAAGFLLAAAVFRPWQGRPGGPTTKEVVKEPPEARPTVLLALATGAVEVLAPGHDLWQPLADGDRVEVGARVRTAADARCEFHTPDGSEVRLNCGTEVCFETPRHLGLDRGQVMATVMKDPVPFEVQVARATVTALGTQFDLWRQPKETRLAVLQGDLRVASGGQQTIVHTDEVMTIVDGRVPEKRRGENLLRETDWVRELLILKGRDNPELARRVDDILAQIGETKAGYLDESEIRKLGYHCALPLTRYIQSDRSQGQPSKRVMAARIVADLAQPASIPDLINLLADKEPGVRYYAARGLERLTAQSQGLSAEEWRDAPRQKRQAGLKEWQTWWEKNKDRYPRVP
jgi:ferric-dicitrate binding protein FerR (iron transport regulator)